MYKDFVSVINKFISDLRLKQIIVFSCNLTMTFTEKEAQKIVESILDDVAKIIRGRKKQSIQEVLSDVNKSIEIANLLVSKASKPSKKEKSKNKKRKITVLDSDTEKPNTESN